MECETQITENNLPTIEILFDKLHLNLSHENTSTEFCDKLQKILPVKVSQHWKIMSLLGLGLDGVVLLLKKIKPTLASENKVALKLFFINDVDGKEDFSDIMKANAEMKVATQFYKYFKYSPQIIETFDEFLSKEQGFRSSLGMVQEYLNTTLKHFFIKIFELPDVKAQKRKLAHFMYRMTMIFLILKQAHLIHGDITLNNIMFSQNSQIPKLIDFRTMMYYDEYSASNYPQYKIYDILSFIMELSGTKLTIPFKNELIQYFYFVMRKLYSKNIREIENLDIRNYDSLEQFRDEIKIPRESNLDNYNWEKYGSKIERLTPTLRKLSLQLLTKWNSKMKFI